MKLFQIMGLAMFAATLSVQAQIPDFTPPSPLFAALSRNDTQELKRLLDEGANPNEGRYIGFPGVFFTLIHHNPTAFRLMVAKGADVKATDPLGSTALMWAAANETAQTELVDELIKMGVDPNARNKKGESALTWALRRGHTPVVAALQRAGANQNARMKEAAELSLSLLQKSGSNFIRVSGCTSCHHQSLPQMATGFARQRGLAVNEQIARQQAEAVIAMFKGLSEAMKQGTDRIPDPAISVSYSLLGLHAEGWLPDEVTSAMAHLISTKQRSDGAFDVTPGPIRPPMESSMITATALSLRAIQAYGKDPEQTVERARQWLRTATPRTMEDRTMQLLGLAWAKASSEDLESAARGLLAEQRPDGGWAQLPDLETDAYATGQALVALYTAGLVSGSDAVYQRGVAFLLRTQFTDGSWLVRSRSYPVQPYKESGFPHGKDQWSSASGTSWAAMALTLAQPSLLQPQGSAQ